MSLGVVGQRCMSEREPELGLGVVASVDPAAKRIGVEFPATREKRLYALGTAVLKRVQFRAGDTVTTRDGATLVIDSVEETAGPLTYLCAGRRVREDAISDVTNVDLPPERLLAGQCDPGEVFDLRYRALQAQAPFGESDVRGVLGGRLGTRAIYALPAFAGVTAGMWAYDTGAGWPGGIAIGLVAAGLIFGVGQLLLAFARPLWLRVGIALAFVAPAAIAGYHATHGIVKHTMPSEGWQIAFSVVGAIAVGIAAFLRIAAMAAPEPAGRGMVRG